MDSDGSHSADNIPKISYTNENESFSKKLQESIQGKGAFKRFKETLYQYDLFNDWNKFKENALRQFVTEWCKDNNLEII